MINVKNLGKGEAILIADSKQRKYFTGFSSTHGYLFIGEEMTLFLDNRYYSAGRKVEGIKVRLYQGINSLKDFVVEKGIKKLYVDYSVTTCEEFNTYKSLCSEIENVSDEIKAKMSVKTASEIEKIKRACEITEKAFYKVLDKVKEGISERELANELEYILKSLGADGTSFETIVAFGENSTVPHHETGNTKLKENQNVLIDFGGVVDGYMADMTRTFFYGEPTAEYIETYNQVLKANEKIIEEITVGTLGKQAHERAVEILDEKDLGKYLTHSLGHGVGVNIHEHPTLGPKSVDEIKEGMVFTIEPGVYIEGKYGIRIEDTVYLKKGKAERLFNDGKNLLIIKKDKGVNL